MKVIISTLNSKYIHSSLALRYLQAYGRTKNEAYEIVEYTINMPILDILNNVTTLDADVIGFACYIWNIDMTLHLCSMIKAVCPSTKIILGGPEVSYTARELLEDHPYIDYIVQGEAEDAFISFVKAIRTGHSPVDPVIPGILGREQGNIQGSEEAVEVKDLSTIPFPYTEEDMLTLGNKIVYYESSRGCPFSCQYCLSGNRNTVRFFPRERVLEELTWFVEHNVKQVKFVDRTFNCAPHHHIPLMEWMRDHGGQTNFHLEMESILMTEKEVDILSSTRHGQIQIEVGVQSTHNKTLEAIHRRNDWGRIQSVIPPIIKAGRTHVHMDLIVGLPYESKSIFEKSFNDLFSLQPHALQIGFLKLLKGSGVRSMAEYEYIANPKAPYEVLQTHVLPYDDVRMLKHFEDVFERFYNSERYRTVFGYISESLIQEGSAFAYFEEMTKLWLEKGNQDRKLNDADQIAFLYEFFTLKGDRVACDLLRYDVLTSFNGKIRDERFGLSKDRKQEMQDAEIFWREEALVRQYISNYSFVEWRKVRQDYHTIEVCGEALPYLGIPRASYGAVEVVPSKDKVYDSTNASSIHRTEEYYTQEMSATKQSKMLCDEAIIDTVIADNTYVIIIDVKGETKPFIRPQQYGNTHLNHFEHNASVAISEEV